MTENKNNNNIKINILNTIRDSGPVTKQKISEQLRINFTTVSKLVNELLLNDGIIIESGNEASSGGRKPKLYRINNGAGYVIGIDIGGQNLRSVVTDLDGNIVKSQKEGNIYSNDKEKITEKILNIIKALIYESETSQQKLFGIGLSISGIIDSDLGKIVYCPNINGLNDFEIKKFVENNAGMPVFVDDSVRCMAIAEKHYGAAKEYDDFLFVTLGKGIGLGICVNGKIYRGSNGLAGELGHITVSEDGPICNCGNRGCLEAIASGPGIIKRTEEGIAKGITTSLTSRIDNNPDNLTVELIAEEAKKGDKFAYYIINRTGEYIGIAVAAALNLFGTELVVIGGGVSESGDIMFNAIKRTVQIRALNTVSKRVRIVKSLLDEFSAARGTATKFINMLFSNHDYNLINRKELLAVKVL